VSFSTFSHFQWYLIVLFSEKALKFTNKGSYISTISYQKRDTTFARATLARSVSVEGEGARKCRFYVLRANVVRANVV